MELDETVRTIDATIEALRMFGPLNGQLTPAIRDKILAKVVAMLVAARR